MPKEDWISIGAVVTPEQKQDVESRAKDCGMSVNEFIKARLFIDDDAQSKKASPGEKWLIRTLSYIVQVTELNAKKSFTEEELKKISNKAKATIERSGFFNNDEITLKRVPKQDA